MAFKKWAEDKKKYLLQEYRSPRKGAAKSVKAMRAELHDHFSNASEGRSSLILENKARAVSRGDYGSDCSAISI